MVQSPWAIFQFLCISFPHKDWWDSTEQWLNEQSKDTSRQPLSSALLTTFQVPSLAKQNQTQTPELWNLTSVLLGFPLTTAFTPLISPSRVFYMYMALLFIFTGTGSWVKLSHSGDYGVEQWRNFRTVDFGTLRDRLYFISQRWHKAWRCHLELRSLSDPHVMKAWFSKEVILGVGRNFKWNWFKELRSKVLWPLMF